MRKIWERLTITGPSLEKTVQATRELAPPTSSPLCARVGLDPVEPATTPRWDRWNLRTTASRRRPAQCRQRIWVKLRSKENVNWDLQQYAPAKERRIEPERSCCTSTALFGTIQGGCSELDKPPSTNDHCDLDYIYRNIEGSQKESSARGWTTTEHGGASYRGTP